jgi:FOG: LysM repeat
MTVSELQRINNLRNQHITLNQSLNIIGTAKVESTDSGTHTVAPGDTLYNISNRYGMTVTELQQLNGLSSNHITLGQTLNVNGTSEVNNTTAQTHTVGPKDTLYNISNRYGMTVAELQQLNELESNHIIIGQTLKVSGESVTTHIVGVGDTIYNIANRYGLTVDELKAKNGLTSDVIKIGQELNI